MDFMQVAAIVGGVAAIMSIGVSIGVYKTKIPDMQKAIDDLKGDVRADRKAAQLKFDKHEEAIGEVEKSIVGIEANMKALLARSTENGSKLDEVRGMLMSAGRAQNGGGSQR
jgi:hypothetical protein